METGLIKKALLQGTIRLEGQFMYGSNYTFMVNCTFQGQSYPAVYKPLRGEQPLWDFPQQTLARREVAAYLVDEVLGWNLVPPTIFRIKKAPLGPGSLQGFIEHDPGYHYFTFTKQHLNYLPKVMVFDLLINNADRKAGHLIVDAEGELWLIDHGLSFHIEDKLRTVVWDHAGSPIPPELLQDVQNFISLLNPGTDLYQALQPHLSDAEIQALRLRAEALSAEGIFPRPPEDRRAYPWPLV
jgi:hypothetical protein